MTKLIIAPEKIEDIQNLAAQIDAVLVGIEGYSVNYSEISFNDLEELVKLKEDGKEIFISLNKNMHNNELPKLREVLKKCSELNVDGIFYADVAVLQICNDLNLSVPLVWASEHMTTNLYTIKYWSEFNIKGAFLSPEITLEEIIEIKNGTNVPLIVQVFGYMPMYVSRRLAVSNYLKHFKLSTDSTKFSIINEGKNYPIVEKTGGTEIYSDTILNAIEEYLICKENGFEYCLLNGINIEIDKFERTIELFKSVTEKNKEEKRDEMDSMFKRTSQGFMHIESIYRVKKNDK